MSLRFPYKKYPSSAGGFFYLAVVPVNIARPEKNAPRSKRVEAIVDSGASMCEFRSDFGRAIGLEIEKGELIQTLAAGGPKTMYVHEITLYIPGGPVQIKAGFSDSLPVIGLLGMKGFFDHFNIVFDPTALRIEIDRLYQA